MATFGQRTRSAQRRLAQAIGNARKALDALPPDRRAELEQRKAEARRKLLPDRATLDR